MVEEDADCEENEGSDDEDQDGGSDDADKTDLELAWENLETARHIYSKNSDNLTSEQRLMYAGWKALGFCTLV